MAKKTNTSAPKKKKITKIDSQDSVQDLYVRYTDVHERRKLVLQGLKSALVSQQQCEDVVKLRSQRYTCIDEVKKEMVAINSSYNKLQKIFPNVRNLISHTEKEIKELHEKIDVLTSQKQMSEDEIEVLDEMTKTLEKLDRKHKKLESPEVEPPKKKMMINSSTNVEEHHEKPKKLTKLERIQNNLSIIEEKLKHL